MNRSKRIIAFIISWTFFAQILTTSVLADTNFKSFEATQGLEDKLPIGDVDGNGTVNSLDFANMRKYLLGMIDDFMSEEDLWVSDVNGDDTFNSIDFAFMRQFLLGMIKEFPKQKLIENPTPTPEPTHTYLKPDYKVEKIEINQIRIKNSISFKVSVTIKNIGADMLDYAPLTTRWGIYELDNTPVSGIALPSDQQLVMLSKNEQVVSYLIIDSFKKGKYKITIDVDKRNEVNELDETNNSLSEVFYVEDDGNTEESATPIELGVKNSGKIDCEDDVDYFKFTTKEAGLYLLEGIEDSDVFLILYKENEEWPIDFCLYGDKFSIPREGFELAADTTYYLKVCNNNSNMLDTYEFCISKKTDDYPDVFELAKTVKIEESISGSIDYTGDIDFFCFTIKEDGVYNFNTYSSLGYPQVYLKDENKNDILGVDVVENRYVKLIANKKYYLYVKSYDDRSFPDYDIKVLLDTSMNDHNDFIDLAEQLNENVEAIGYMEVIFDTDYFKFTPEMTAEYEVFCESNSSIELYLYDSSGSEINRGDSVNPYYYTSVLEKGSTYYVKLCDNSYDSTGSYKIRVKLLADDYGNTIERSTIVGYDEVIVGEIEYIGDSDWFSFTPSKSSNYGMILSGLDGIVCPNVYDYEGKSLYNDTINEMSSNIYTGLFLEEYRTYYFSIENKNDLGVYSFKISEVGDDHGNNFETSTNLSMGDEVAGRINYECDEDFFSIKLSKSDIYRIETTGNTDTEAYIYDENGNELFYDNTSGEDQNFRIDQSMEGGQTYYIKVKQNTPEGTGDYSIRFIPLYDDFGDYIQYSEELTLYDEKYTFISDEDEVHYFSFIPYSTDSYRVETFFMTDPSVIIYNSNGIKHAESTKNIINPDLNCFVNVGMEADKKYYIAVKSNTNEFIRYGIKIEPLFDDHGCSFETAINIVSDTHLTGKIQFENDCDYFRLTAYNSTKYGIEIIGDYGVVAELYNENYDKVKTCINEYAEIYSNSDTTYYIKIIGNAECTSYRLRVFELGDDNGNI